MTVRDRAFRRYTGPTTPRLARFLVLWRYARRDVFTSRRVTALYALSFAPVLIALTIVYLRHNLPALQALELSVTELVPVDGQFFFVMMQIQGFFAFALTALVGPGLVSPDLANNGLPLYLCRPFSRAEYVLGKMSVLAILISSMTWVPLLVLTAVQASLEPGWLARFGHVPWGIFAGSWLAILVLSLLALALSAWIKWRILAAAMIFATLLVADAVAELLKEIFRTQWGQLVSPATLVVHVWESMLVGSGMVSQLPQAAAWLGLGVFCTFCLLVLHLKLRAYEVVR